VPYSHVPTQRYNIERRIVQRAWSDPEYKARLLADPKAAVAEELGVELPERLQIDVVEERPDRLCIVIPVDMSGIPRPTAQVMMGLPPEPRPASK
jgi:hypothetical protein